MSLIQNQEPINESINIILNFNHYGQCQSIRNISSLVNCQQTDKLDEASLLFSQAHGHQSKLARFTDIHLVLGTEANQNHNVRIHQYYVSTLVQLYTVHVKALKPQLIHRISICFNLKHLFQLHPFPISFSVAFVGGKCMQTISCTDCLMFRCTIFIF